MRKRVQQLKVYARMSAIALAFGSMTFSANAQTMNYQWNKQMVGPNNDFGRSICTDKDGNVIMVNDFSGSYDADPGTGTTTLSSAGGTDMAISKFDADGNLIWAKQIGGSSTDIAYRVVADANGNVFVTGGFSTTVDFNSGPATENRTSAGGLDIFLLKLDANGDFQWVYTNGVATNEEARGVAVDQDGNVYMSGYFRSTMDFDAGAGTSNLTAFGGADVFVLKLTSAGNFVSVYQAGGTTDEDPFSITVDYLQNVYVAGYYSGTCDFQSGAGTQNLIASGGNDGFVLKINANFTFSWVRQFGGSSTDLINSIKLDREGNLVFGGFFSGTMDINSDAGTQNVSTVGGRDMFIAKLTTAGNFVWGITAGGVFDDELYSVDIDNSNNILSTGFMRGTVDFDPGAGTQNVTVAGGGGFADQFYWKVSENGNYLFAGKIGDTNNDHALQLCTYDQFVYSTGYFNGTADFDLGAGTANFTATTSDVFVLKHVNCNTIHTNDVVVSCGPITWIDGNTYSSNNSTATHQLTSIYGCDSIVHLNLMIKSIADQQVSSSVSTLCDSGDVTIDINSSETGVFYSLIDQSTMSVLDGSYLGNGSSLSFDGGLISSTTTYEVLAEKNRFNSITFDGNSASDPDYISLGTDLTRVFGGATEMTVEAWINPSNTNSLQTVLGNYGPNMQLMLRLDQVAGLKARLWVGTSSVVSTYNYVTSTSDIPTNTWTHIAGVMDGDSIYIFVNGVRENAVAHNVAIPELNNEFRIGGGLSNNTEYFFGDITGVRFWNVARSASDINGNMSSCIPASSNGLVAMYNMADGSGSTIVTDESLNGYNGMLMNMDENTVWQNTNMPSISCAVCSQVMSITPTVVVNESTSSTHVVTACNTYTWIDGNTYTSNNNTATHTLTNAVGCDSIVTLDLTINTVSNVTVTTSGLTITASNASATYQWLDCSNSFAVIASQTGSSFTATANGSYAVELTENGCKDTSACVNITTVGFEDLSTDNEITVYPNPTQGKVNLVLGQQMNNATVIVRNALGQEIFRSSYATVNNIELNIEGENGIYFVEIFSEGEKAMVKVVKH